MWTIWDKQSEINGFSAERFLNRRKILANEDTIYIKTINGRAVQVEGKNILADIYGIDPALPNDEFIVEYERVLAEREAEALEAEPEPEPEGADQP